MVKTPPGELKRVTPLAAAQIKDAFFMRETEYVGEKIDFGAGDRAVVDDVAVGFQIERVEDGAPPVRVDMFFEVRDGTEHSSGFQASPSLGRFFGSFFLVHRIVFLSMPAIVIFRREIPSVCVISGHHLRIMTVPAG
jgi:hypothetical protein